MQDVAAPKLAIDKGVNLRTLNSFGLPATAHTLVRIDGELYWDGGVLSNTPYNYGMRFENEKGTNPEELLGAAHAACFTMALGAQLTKAGHTPTSIESTAVVHLNKVGEGFSIATIPP